MDFIALSEDNKTVYFVELKTDQGSIRKEQIINMHLAKERNINKLTDDIITVYNVSDKNTPYKEKHHHLIKKLVKIGWIVKKDGSYKSSANNAEIKIVFILPSEKKIEDFDIISLKEIAETLNSLKDPFTKRFVQSLSNWTNGFSE